MTLSEAKKEIEKRSIELVDKSNNNKGYICPICEAGSGEGETGIISNDNIHFTCQKGCFSNVGILEIIALKCGMEEDDAIVMCAEQLNIEIDGVESPEEKEEEIVIEEVKEEKVDILQGQITPESPNPDYSLFYEEMAKEIDKCNFMQSIGITKEMQERFNMGYCVSWIHPNTSADVRQYITATPRIIIPTSKYSYVARYVGDNKNVAKMQRAGIPSLFNAKELYTSQEPLFIFEDEIEAISLMECGYDAMALGGINQYTLLVDALKERKSERLLIISIKANEENQVQLALLREELKEMYQDFIMYSIVGDYNDANEVLVADKEILIEGVKTALEKVSEYELDKVKDYQVENSNIGYIDDFMEGITVNTATPCIPTNIPKIDEMLDGGLYEGLYILGGESSVGKTTLALQITDGIVTSNSTDVLYFSVETGRNELIAKSLSRITAEMVIKKKQVLTNAKTSRDITVKEKYDKYGERDKKQINEACKKYAELARSIYMYEGSEDIGALKIRSVIEEHIENTKRARRKTVAIIDYLQILSAFDDKQRTDKQNIELNMSELKRISRDCKIPIIIISSYDFANYEKSFEMDEYNDTKSIENASDVLISLQLNGAKASDFNKEEAKKQNPRDVEIKVLKNRNGVLKDKADMLYYPEYNLFIDKDINVVMTKETILIKSKELTTTKTTTKTVAKTATKTASSTKAKEVVKNK